MPTIRFRGNREEVKAATYRLVRILTGKEPDDTGIIEGLILRLGLRLLSFISRDYVTMSQGGTGELGIQWKPLSLVTLLLRRAATTPAALRKVRKNLAKASAEERKQFKLYYRQLVGFYRGRNGRKEGRHALSILKRKRNSIRRQEATIGAAQVRRRLRVLDTKERLLRKVLAGGISAEKAKKAALAAASALILRDTGRLLDSLSPGAIVGPVSADQQLRFDLGTLIAGTNVDYAKYHQSDKPRKLKADGTPKLPRRQFLPDDGVPIPDHWWGEMLEVLVEGLAQPELWARLLGEGRVSVA